MDSDSLWNGLHPVRLRLREHDRFWQMLLDEKYRLQIYDRPADLGNTGPRSVLQVVTH
ncbi:hypothetical protein L226DRAFT_540318 [Lentinus tigrinus ALCF2SS1-7]|uniref:uncharacterized protein n=1 Tax=Lentinus tigrinus ALCF2SS1-7 TaxID=1328758 RepID=UPI001165E8F0|nr:hypothetical protein L226DRAFT_540318 [Lentinus tigrinus ALCF2SS1-7]